MPGDEAIRWSMGADGDAGRPRRLTGIDTARGDAKLMLRPADDGSGAQLLMQSDRPVGALTTGDHGTRLETPSESFAIERSAVSWRGWRIELVRQGTGMFSLSFKPAPVWPGGVFITNAGQRYKLRCRVFSAIWHLRGAGGELIATLRPDKFRLEYDIELEPAAALADSLVALLLASCWMIGRLPWGVPGGGGDGGGG
jgi:hypothetical protein